jgi:hypothetical protein
LSTAAFAFAAAGEDPGAAVPPAPAVAVAVFVWATGPWLPGLATRIETFTFCGAACSDVATAPSAPGAAVVSTPVPPLTAVDVALFVWATGPPSPLELTRTETFRFVGVDWVDEAAPWATGALFPPVVDGPLELAVAVAPALALFAWETGPLLPGWSTRTSTFEFAGAVCVDPAVAAAAAFGSFVLPPAAAVDAFGGLVAAASGWFPAAGAVPFPEAEAPAGAGAS